MLNVEQTSASKIQWFLKGFYQDVCSVLSTMVIIIIIKEKVVIKIVIL